jgi:ribose transport system substrate-binding protein
MRLKVLVTLLAALALAAVLSACGSSGSSSSSGGGGSTGGSESSSTNLKPFEETVATALKEPSEWPKDAPTEPIKNIEPGKLIVDIPCGFASPGCRVIGEAAGEAAEKLGWQFKMIDGEFSPAKQRAAFEQAIALNADAIITQGIDPTQFADVIKKAHADGIRYVAGFSDNPVGELNEAEIDTKAAESGKIIASKAIVDNGGEGQYALFNFPVYHVLRDRMESANKTIEECSGCEVVSETKINPAEAANTLSSATSAVVQKYPDLSAIITGIDNFAAEQVPTLNSLNYEGGLYSVNGEEQALTAIEKGDENATVANPLVWGGWASIDNAARLFAEQPVNNGGLPLHLIDAENMPKELTEVGYEPEFDFKGEYEKLWGLK